MTPIEELSIVLSAVHPTEETQILLDLLGDGYKLKLGQSGASVADEAPAVAKGVSRTAQALWWGSLTTVQKDHVVGVIGGCPASWAELVAAKEHNRKLDLPALLAKTKAELRSRQVPVVDMLLAVDAQDYGQRLQASLEPYLELVKNR